MAFLAPLAAAAGRGLLMRAGASMLGRTAAGSAEGATGGGGAGSALSKVTKSPVMPIPSMGSNGGSNPPAMGPANSYLNADQFR